MRDHTDMLTLSFALSDKCIAEIVAFAQINSAIYSRYVKYTEKMNRVHLVIFQYDNPCSAGNISTRLTVAIPLILLILFSFNTESC